MYGLQLLRLHLGIAKSVGPELLPPCHLYSLLHIGNAVSNQHVRQVPLPSSLKGWHGPDLQLYLHARAMCMQRERARVPRSNGVPCISSVRMAPGGHLSS